MPECRRYIRNAAPPALQDPVPPPPRVLNKAATLFGGLAALALGTSIPQHALAQTAPLTTAALQQLCAAQPSDFAGASAVGSCRGFMTGVGQYHAELTRAGSHERLFCLPDPSPTFEQAQASFTAWAQTNPQYAETRAVEGLMRWAVATYACPQVAPARSRR